MRNFPKNIAVVQLLPLPGASGAALYDPRETVEVAGARAIEEARLLSKLGYDGILLENSGDAPCAPGRARPETIASIALIAAAVRESCPRVSLGVTLLEQDGRAAAALAAVVGADFIRIPALRLAGFQRFKSTFCPKVAVIADCRADEIDEILMSADAVILREVPQAQGGGKMLRNRWYLSDIRAGRGAGLVAGVALRVGGRRGARIDAKKAQSFLQKVAEASA